jgi:ABC-2 type transport system ATP-binding protein
MENTIEVRGLEHRFGHHVIYQGLDLAVPCGRVVGLLGKNGVGKTTLIKILMGFLRPLAGSCTVLGEPAHALRPETRARIGLLFEGHVAYEFLSIAEAERFHAAFYPGWRGDVFDGLMRRLGLPPGHRIKHMSEGQRSQVVLGLILAQDPELLILDDYSMGLDAGYRRLFLDVMDEYLDGSGKTVLVTSHVIQDMEKFVDELVFLERGGRSLRMPIREFRERFRRYVLPRTQGSRPEAGGVLKNVEEHAGHWELFSFDDGAAVREALESQGVAAAGLDCVGMNLEDAFIGFTGRY